MGKHSKGIPRNRVTRLNKRTVKLSNDIEFKVVDNITDKEFQGLLDDWTAITYDYSAENLCAFVKLYKPSSIFVTEAQYDKITAGRSTPATKEEYEAENN